MEAASRQELIGAPVLADQADGQVAQLDKGLAITELLSRGSKVRVVPGAPIPKEFASSARRKIFRRTQIEQSDQSCEFAPVMRN
jgi:hypothetical protein